MIASPTRGLSRRGWAVVTAGAIALVLLVPMAFGAGLVLHSECVLTRLGTETIWTPGLVVNSPPNGSARGWGNDSQHGVGWGSPLLSNGSAGVLEIEMNWTVSRAGMAWVAGPGVRHACTVPYWATVAVDVRSTNSTWCLLQGPGSPSDVGLSSDTPVAGCPFLGTGTAARLNASFATVCANQSAYQGGCGAMQYAIGPGNRISFRASVIGFPIEIPIPARPAGAWLAVADPMNQTVVSSLSGPGCWVEETVGGPVPAVSGLRLGLLTWGTYAMFPTSGTTPACAHG
ncbi:MAG: hypothetical protein L3K01_00080 [Thermoplasmata archaeon]|nr:hypothetical protein [Thermoplasmata archaeon]